MPPDPDPDHPTSRLLFSHTLDIVLDTVLHFLPSRRDRGAASLVSRSWHAAEARTRREVFVGNCYAVYPPRAARRFPNAVALVVKGRPRFADFSLVPPGWGAGAGPWVTAAAGGFRWLERVCFKRMSVTDEDLGVVARAFAGFREICLVCCEGFGGAGISAVAANCRHLRVLDLIDDEVEDDGVDWISKFSEKTTSLESLMFDCVTSEVNFQALESLVARSPRLKKLRVNYHVTSVQLCRLMARAPQLTHLGTGSFRPVLSETSELGALVSAFSASNSLVCLSGFHDISPDFLPAIYPVCGNLTSLNLSYAEITSDQLKPAIANCHNLQKFWALDSVGDEGLVAVAAACVDLRELRIFPINAQEDSESAVSDVGLTAISRGCRKLRSILYFCQRMTNDAVVAMSINCPDLVVFRLCIMGLHRPDRLSGLPMDEGFGAIVKNCKKLTRLAVSGWLTDRAFEYIGSYGKLLRTLSVAFAGNSDVGLKYVLEGCPRLQKLEIRDSPFGDSGFLSGLHHYYNMRFLWMSSCKLSLRSCKEVAWRLPRMVVEVIRDVNSESKIHEDDEDCQPIEKLYMYRSLAGPRTDAPPFVTIL